MNYDGGVLGNQLFFGRNGNGFEIWSTDGTVQGTQMVYAGIGFQRSTVMNGKLYFRSLFDGNNGLWETDGTEMGTQLIDTLPGMGSSDLYIAALDNDTLVMMGENNLWASDGTPNGAEFISDVRPVGPFFNYDSAFFVFNGVAYFYGSLLGVENVWQSDGTVNGTTIFQPGFASGFASLDGSMYFGGTGGVFKSDGTQNGTLLLIDDGGWGVRGLEVAGSRYIFAGVGYHLWSTDGTVQGSHQVFEVVPGSGLVQDFTVGPAHHFFRMDDNSQNPPEYWVAGCRNPQ
jgi:ELWxxDGT repeat protein